MSHTVVVKEFEGPLGLLLELVEGGKLEVTAISVAHVTAQYLARLKQLTVTPAELGEFLQLGARLLYIKSLALLPQAPHDTEQTDELRQLNRELSDYRRFQAAARELANRAHSGTWERRVTERLAPADLPLPNLELSTLAGAFTAALKRLEPARETKIIPEHISQASIMHRLRARLTSGFGLQEVLDACRHRLEIIVTFLALLELIRNGDARVTQANQFAPIIVEAAHA